MVGNNLVTPIAHPFEATNQDARSSMAGELAKLLQTAPDNSDKTVMEPDLAGFRRLFDTFVTQPGPNVVWDKIEKLPNNSVRFENIGDILT